LNVHATFQRTPAVIVRYLPDAELPKKLHVYQRSIEFLTLVMAIDQQRFYAIARGSAMEAAAVLDTSG
jgi:hypothetical protein